MKTSKYNHFFRYDENNSIAYNALSNALAIISNDDLETYQKYAKNEYTNENTEILDSLKHGLFLIDDDVNELDIVRYRMLCERYATHSLSLTIAPTNACNFRCVYCYEKNVISNTVMSSEVQEEIIKMIKERQKSLKYLSVVWYGGEPLLAMDVIRHLSERILDICNQNDIQYKAYMITNGFLLSKEILKELKMAKVEFLQITVDGMAAQHNKRRPLCGGGDTLDTILSNLREGYDLLPYVSLRINVDKNNVNDVQDIHNYLKEHQLIRKVHPYLGRVRADNDCYSVNTCMDEKEFAYVEEFFYDETNQSRNCYPKLKHTFCCADKISGFVIAADGYVYKCWSDIGHIEKSIGKITDNLLNNKAIFFSYIMFDPTEDAKCKQCDILPLCMGGCPFQRIRTGKTECIKYKYNLENFVKNFVLRAKNQK